ncbi:hypothetical protein [Deinococcus altitudinis]|uniref:hypothetical protein n=1 Tax=Deinococcus altitudinis TaxID=468914 RepID=UPI0038914DC5
MTRPDPILPAPVQRRFHTSCTQALVSLMLSLTAFLLGWHLSEQGHSRLPSASQTSPALPELRPLAGAQPAIQGVGTAAEPLSAAPPPHWTAGEALPVQPNHDARTDLVTLGRMNLDGG